MKKNLIVIGVIVFVFFVSAQNVMAEENIHLILDASGSMWGKVEGREKIVIAKEVLTDLIAKLPQDIQVASYG